MEATELIRKSEPFLRYLVDWEIGLPTLRLAEVAADPRRAAVISIDVINGFCNTGPLASPRIQGIVAPIADLLRRAHSAGVEHMLLVQEAHEPDALEFAQFPRHGVRGTAEAEAVPELKALPFYSDMTIFTKNSIHPALNNGLEAWLDDHPHVTIFIAVGDCTDLCTYQLGMYLRLRANAQHLEQRVIVPANCSQTFDTSLTLAQELGAVPHDADLLHLIFLYSLSLNGVEVARAIE
jgi:nicotinamidase-related amidase